MMCVRLTAHWDPTALLTVLGCIGLDRFLAVFLVGKSHGRVGKERPVC